MNSSLDIHQQEIEYINHIESITGRHSNHYILNQISKDRLSLEEPLFESNSYSVVPCKRVFIQ